MTPEREAEIRAWCKEWPTGSSKSLSPTFAHDLLEALDQSRARVADLQSYIVELGEAKARESEQVGTLRARVAKLERVANGFRALGLTVKPHAPIEGVEAVQVEWTSFSAGDWQEAFDALAALEIPDE